MTQPSDIQFDLIIEMSQMLAANERKVLIELSELKGKMASDISNTKNDIIKRDRKKKQHLQLNTRS